MKKIIFWALGIIFLIGVLGNSSSSTSAVQGIETTKAPTIIDATATPTTTPTVYILPTSTSTPTPTVATQTQSSGLSNDSYYTNVDGAQVHSPAYSNSVPAGASAVCGDGTYSFSLHHSGTCSHHGGVAEWL